MKTTLTMMLALSLAVNAAAQSTRAGAIAEAQAEKA